MTLGSNIFNHAKDSPKPVKMGRKMLLHTVILKILNIFLLVKIRNHHAPRHSQ